ncbi:MAG: DUF1156 domain-containing protein [Gemmatimonadota bacterium]|nr:DUF1156 domain-containing protein [Gemmatimonadota bacterium]
MTSNDKRLIEVAFPLKQVSLDSVHEKNVRHGHISTLHIWPARRPLAACRAALIATLLPDPGDRESRNAILERMAGRIVEKIDRKRVNGRLVEKIKEETLGGILRWKRENGPDIEWFRKEIRKAYGGRAPKVLDPFAGGGAIPLEAMRLGCDVTAMDINPVAWFILKCTLEYPQKLGGQTRPLPDFSLEDAEFMEAFLKAKGLKGASLRTFLERMGHGDHASEIQLNALARDDATLEADLAWHVRAWGRWVLARARKQLASHYPTYAEFEPQEPGRKFKPQSIRLLEIDNDGIPQLDPINAGFDAAYLKDPRNPRWIAKPTVAYLWARTVVCKQCRATLPLLKTRWLCKKDRKRVLLTISPDDDRTEVHFGVENDVPHNGGNAAQRREHDKRIGAGTMSRTGATCPCCGAITTMADVRYEGRAGRLGAVMTAVVVEGAKGKEYRLPTDHERAEAEVTEETLDALYHDIPLGLPLEPTPKSGIGASRAFSVDGYGIDTWRKLFTNRQLMAIGSFVLVVRRLMQELDEWPADWREGLITSLMLVNDRLTDYSSTICSWHNSGEKLGHTFARFALPIVWDYTEVNPLSDSSGNFHGALDWVARVVAHTLESAKSAEATSIQNYSATGISGDYDAIVTDPPYYDAIPYSDLMDFFYLWLRRSIQGLSPEFEEVFSSVLCPKWNHDTNDGELIDDASRFGGDRERSRQNYEDGMARSFLSCHVALRPDGRLVVVFANKHPDAWETLVAALIRAGFVVDGSWPIQTEMGTRTRAMASAALSSSVWIVCKKRSAARPGWDNTVLNEMRDNIRQQLRDFWDAGIRGADFVWAATGPALEAFSKHPVVKKANDPNQLMSVSEFLREVRRMVVDFVVGRVLTQDGEQEAVTGLDDVTTYYLLHRYDFGMEKAPVGGCILYALSCNLSDSKLVNQHDLLAQEGKGSPSEGSEEDAPPEDAEESGGGAKVKLKPWNRRQGRNLGLEAPGGRPTPLIDQLHRLMHIWRAGDQVKVDDYLDTRGLQRNALFNQILQALIELAETGSDERSILEALSNHIAARGDVGAPGQSRLQFGSQNSP